MRKPLIFSLTLLAATALLLVGCNPILPSEGNKVKFKAHSKSQPATKTAYAGNAASTGSSHEDIYWSEGDDIRIYSGNTAVVTPAFANYELVISRDKTRATLQNPAEAPNGLAWVTDPAQGNDDVTFYAVYPPSTQGSESGWFTMSIPSEQTFATPTETDMKHAYMLAQNTLTRSQFNSEVSLEFYPAFTAFQINLKSKDDELTLKKFRIYSEDNHLAGDYYGKLKAVNTSESENEYFAFNSDKSLRMDFAYCSNNLQNEVFVEFPFVEDANTGTRTYTEKISSDKAVDFTLLALPYGIVNATETYDTKPYLTNLWLEVTFEKENGEEFTKKLALKQTTTTTVGEESTTTTDFYKFASCKKYCINGLAVDGGSKWRLTIDGEVLPWTYDEKKTTFTQNVQSGPFTISGALETTDAWMDNDVYGGRYWNKLVGKMDESDSSRGAKGSNHYESYDTGANTEFKTYSEWVALGSGQETYNDNHESYYQLFYQLRTLDMSITPVQKRRFDVTFRPMAPLGGYWTLSTADAPSFGNTAQGGTEGFRIVLWDGESEITNWSSGQIMNQEITIRVYPSDSRDPSKEYCMIIKASFSPNKNGEPTYSADSEIQDVHGDGRYSYWKFVIPATE